MKKTLLTVLGVVLLAVVLVNFGAVEVFAASGNSEWQWKRKVEIVNPFSPGGGADVMIRAFTPILSKELGVACEVFSAQGGGGANGVDYTSKQPTDGYTFMLATNSMLLMDLQKILAVDFSEKFVPICMMVNSINSLFSSTIASKGKFSTFEELITYVKTHPLEITCGITTITGSEAASFVSAMSKALNVPVSDVTKYIKMVTFEGTGEKTSALVGGHVHLATGGTAEMGGLVDAGNLGLLISFCQERLSTYPDAPCTGELGLDAYIGTWRGLFAYQGTPQAAIDSFIAACDRAWHSPEYQKFLAENSYLDRTGWLVGEDFDKWIEEEYGVYKEYLKAMGIIK